MPRKIEAPIRQRMIPGTVADDGADPLSVLLIGVTVQSGDTNETMAMPAAGDAVRTTVCALGYRFRHAVMAGDFSYRPGLGVLVWPTGAGRRG